MQEAFTKKRGTGPSYRGAGVHTEARINQHDTVVAETIQASLNIMNK